MPGCERRKMDEEEYSWRQILSLVCTYWSDHPGREIPLRLCSSKIIRHLCRKNQHARAQSAVDDDGDGWITSSTVPSQGGSERGKTSTVRGARRHKKMKQQNDKKRHQTDHKDASYNPQPNPPSSFFVLVVSRSCRGASHAH
jgi:hypothetical protein